MKILSTLVIFLFSISFLKYFQNSKTKIYNFLAFLNIRCSKYSTGKSDDTQLGSDQAKEKVFKKVPPLPTPPPTSPSMATATSVAHNHASCDKNQCPPTCPVYEECMKDEKPPSNYMYWKQVLVGLLLTGISLYVVIKVIVYLYILGKHS